MTTAVVVLSVALATSLVALAAAVRRLGDERAPAVSAAEPEPPEVPAEPSLGRLVAALDALDLGVVVAGPDDALVFRNRAAHAVLTSRDSRSIVESAVGEMLAGAVEGRASEREIDLFGPPSATYLVRALPLERAPLDDGDHRRRTGGGGVAVIEDITERRRTDQVRRDFVSNISHELKTPVGALGLLAETLRDERDPKTVKRFTERIGFEVARLSRTIDDLLELSRIEFGDDLEIGEEPVVPMVEDAVGRFEGAAEARGITLDLVRRDDVTIHGDRRQITSAVSNLVDNAVKYSPDGARVEISVSAERPSVAIEVTDHGDGIPTRDLDRVFERFYRVDRARSRETGGTGLGLAIVRHVAHNHGGEVTVRSKEGQGSTFRLVLPVEGPAGGSSGDATTTIDLTTSNEVPA